MRRAGLLIAGVFLATGAGLALSAPASAAVNGGWSDCDDYGHGYYYGGYHHYYHHGWYHHRHHHGGSVWIGIGVNGD